MRENAFCIDCGDVNGYKIKSRRREIEHQGLFFFVEERYAVCDKCGGEVYLPELNEENALLQWLAYAEACEKENAKQRG